MKEKEKLISRRQIKDDGKKTNPTVVGQHGVSQPKISGNVIQYKIITLHDTWYF